MQNDLISRSALLEVYEGLASGLKDSNNGTIAGFIRAITKHIKLAPAVDAVVLPKGRPGDYLEWDNGAGHKQVYFIHAVMICKGGCMRYELASFAPVVGHPSIVRIFSKEEAETMIAERREQLKKRREKRRTNDGR